MRSIAVVSAILVGLAWTTVAGSSSRVTLTAGRAEIDGKQIRDLEVAWNAGGPAAGRLAVRAGRIEGIAETGPLSRFAISCTTLKATGDRLDCEGGRLSGELGALGDQDTRFTARLMPDGNLVIRLDALALAGGRARIDYRTAGDDWDAEAGLEALDVAEVAELAEPFFSLPEGLTVAGVLSGYVEAAMRDDVFTRIDAELAFADASFANAEGTLAGEGVGGELDVTLSPAAGGWRTEGRLALAAGQAYSDPVFLDFGQQAMTLEFGGRLAEDASRFDAERFALRHEGVSEISGSAVLDLAGETLLLQARTHIANLDLAPAMPAYVQPFLISTAFKDIEGAGTVRGELDVDAGLPSRFELTLEDVYVDSQIGSASVSGLSGRLAWFDEELRNELGPVVDSDLFKSRLRFEGATLWGIEFGAAELPFTTTGRHFRMLDPVLLPIFDGGLAIETLRVRHAGTERMYVRFDAELRPVSVARLSRALGWPEFSGTLSGRIPKLELSEGLVTLGGNIEAQVFDGLITIRDLRMRNPLGRYPRLYANIDADHLDLEQITNTFEFGMMTGRISGSVRGLETFDWMPEAFDASFATPRGDRSKHRISQRAVSNLSRIGGGSGGGVAAALQGGFLRFFDSFGYDRVGLSCRLENDICRMDGVEPHGDGYYIVKGKGIPRIDVIGNQKRVAWRTLVRQLASIAESGGPVVQ